jgi:small subunit ribosomal protein S9
MKDQLIASGKRKRSVARALIRPGKGNITINKAPYTTLDFFKRMAIEEPINIAKKTLGDFNFDVEIKVVGGGKESRIEASRLAIAKALINFTKSEKLKKAFLAYDRNLLVADTRRKEAYKPGDSKARAKRQKSYR